MRSSIRCSIVFLGLLAVSAVPAWGASPHLGVLGGIQLAGVTYHSDFFEHDLRLRPSWSAGLQCVVPIASLELETGVRYAEYGDRLAVRFDVTGGSYAFAIHQVWRYVAVPALFRYHPPAGRGVFLSFGPEVGHLLEVWHEETLTASPTMAPARAAARSAAPYARIKPHAAPVAQIFEDVGTVDDPTHAYKRWNLDVSGGIGFEYRLARQTAEFQLRYTHGLVDIAKSSSLRRETRGLELLTGVHW